MLSFLVGAIALLDFKGEGERRWASVMDAVNALLWTGGRQDRHGFFFDAFFWEMEAHSKVLYGLFGERSDRHHVQGGNLLVC